jgi:hypothetical protein
MTTSAARKMTDQLARLNVAAEWAGCALACVHQSADELHRALVRDYLNLHPRRRPIAHAAAVVVLAALLVAI